MQVLYTGADTALTTATETKHRFPTLAIWVGSKMHL